MKFKSLLALVFLLGLGSPAQTRGSREIGSARSIAGSRQSGTGRQSHATPRDEAPLSVGEIISMLEQSGAGKVSQGDIAAQVFKRGISFTPDDRSIEEIRQAGGELFLLDTIQRAREPITPPKLTVRTSDTDPDPDPQTELEERRRAKSEMMARMPLIEQARNRDRECGSE